MSESDKELEALKQRKLHELQKRVALKEQKKEQGALGAPQILDKIFRGRAWEVFNAARAQFPNEMVEVEHVLTTLALEGKINELEGEQLFAFLREVGLPVRLNTTIKVLSNGKMKALSEKFAESTK